MPIVATDEVSSMTEVILHICSYLEPKDLCKLALVDTQLRALASDDSMYGFPLSIV